MERTSKRHVEIFNFSFLDILACVIGLLIFILTVVVISGGINSAGKKPISGTPLGELEDKVRIARQVANAAANRRKEAEQRLNQMAGDIGVSPGPLDAPARVAALSAEANQLQRIMDDFQNEKNQLNQQSLDLDAALSVQNRLATLQQETTRLEKANGDLQAKTKELAAGPPKGRDISYYVPRLRPTEKMQSWLEISNGKAWRLDSSDYVKTRSGIALSYVRSALAAGTPVDSIVKNKTIPMESGKENVAADMVVVTCIVRPDGYDDFRRLRDLAWGKGYSVHWIPLDKSERIVLTLGSGVEQ